MTPTHCSTCTCRHQGGGPSLRDYKKREPSDFPWQDWVDGKTRYLVRGTDFHMRSTTMVEVLQYAAENIVGIPVYVRVEPKRGIKPGRVAFSFGKPLTTRSVKIRRLRS